MGAERERLDQSAECRQRLRPRLPWFWRFVERLLENEPTVTALLEKNPFADKPPTYVRAQFYDYTFAGGEQKGQWWNRRLLGESFPMVHLKVPVNRGQ